MFSLKPGKQIARQGPILARSPEREVRYEYRRLHTDSVCHAFSVSHLKSSRSVEAYCFAKSLNSLWYGLFLGRRLYEMARTGRAFFFPARIATAMTRALGRQETHHALLPGGSEDQLLSTMMQMSQVVARQFNKQE